MFKKSKGLFLALTLLSSLLAAVAVVSYTGHETEAARTADFKQQVRNALNEISFPADGSLAAVESASERLTGFLSYRAGVLLSDWTADRLIDAEKRSKETGKRISKDRLAELLAKIAVNKLRNLSEEQKQSAIDTIGGFDHPDLPESFARGREFVSLRADGTGNMTRAELSSHIDSIRGENAESRIVASMIRNAIALEIESVCDALLDADPEMFGGTKCEMTPMQALLVSYAVATDDQLAGNRGDVSAKMAAIESAASDASGSSYPSHIGNRPYGANGYIFSTPADVLLDEGALKDLVLGLKQEIQ